MIRRTDGVSTFDFMMNNARRKYDGVFTPNDRIIVLLKRVTWVRVFTGLLNSAPLKTAWPKPVSLSASCSLKRIQYWYWDSYTAETQTMVNNALSENNHSGNPDGAIINVIQTILQKVMGWPKSKVHIGRIPEDWFKIAASIAKKIDADAEESDRLKEEFLSTVGAGASVGGIPVTTAVMGRLTQATTPGSR